MKLMTKKAAVRMAAALGLFVLLLLFSRRDYVYFVTASGVHRSIGSDFEWPFVDASWGHYSWYLGENPDHRIVVHTRYGFGLLMVDRMEVRLDESRMAQQRQRP